MSDRPKLPPSDWTDERRAELRERWGRRETATDIAAAIGGVTRNQVIAEAHCIIPLFDGSLPRHSRTPSYSAGMIGPQHPHSPTTGPHD